MRTLASITLLIATLCAARAFGQKGNEPTQASFTVYGNCSMCQERIETAATRLKGVRKAHWDREKKSLTVSYDPQKLQLKDIHKAVAAVGHDTEEVRAPDKAYEALHGCCQYERPARSFWE
ncbi:MAG: heavy-metal-associated domain-containing protein [Bacteroidetes bacterium]|nr:heavy-metal-associated domain-containing protein [Bacteroidota bacterium]